MKKKKEYIAILQVKFDPDIMCDEETIKQEYGGSWSKCMKSLYASDGEGIFENPLELVKVIIKGR